MAPTAPADSVKVRESDRSWTLRDGTPATEPGRATRPRPARFVRVLPDSIDSGLALPDGHALAQAGERIWEWSGAQWSGAAPIARRLAPHTTEGLWVTGFVPERLALGPSGEAWLCGRRHTTATGPSPDLPTAVRRRGAVWVEDAALRASFAARVFEDFGTEAGPRLRVASSPTASVACGAQHCRLPSGAVIELGDTTVSVVGRVGGEPWVLTDQALAKLEGDKLVVRAEAAPLASPVALWGATDDDLWALGPSIAHHVAEQGWSGVASPVGTPTAIWGSATDDVWLTGELGVAHWDGRAWTRVIGLHGPVRDVFGVAGHVWFATSDGLWELGRWTPLPAREPPVLSSTASRHGHTRLAPVGADRGWLLDEFGVVRVEGASRTPSALRLPVLTALVASGADELWMVGGLHVTHNEGEAWPAGEGLVVHRSRSGVVWHRVPTGPLQAVAATGPGEAWAVGAAGLVVHVRAGAVTAQRLDSDRWLRDVALGQGGELWIVGDDGTLLHGNGTTLGALTGPPLPPRPQLVSVAARSQGRAWVASPDGILDVTARGGCP